MKNILIIITISLILIFQAQAQITLTYENHALQSNVLHSTQYVENVAQGPDGANQIWDFTDFACNKIKTTELLSAENTKNYNNFPSANLAITDDDNFFYFNVNKNVNEYLGLITPDAIISFDKPIIKMVYPFTYGDEVSGDFAGEGLYYGDVISNIYGDYTVKADAYGTLLLPNNVSIQNVLRVKSVNHIFETVCQTTEFINEKYLWYSEDNRLPIMVVVIDKKIVGGVETLTNYGYYSEDAFETNLEQTNTNISEFSVKTYPNPFTDFINVSYDIDTETNVTVEIYNPIGQKIETLVDNQIQEGYQLINYNVNNKSFAIGSYYVRIQIGENIIMKKMIKFE